MDGTRAQRSIDALIDDVDAALLPLASSQFPPPLPRVDRAKQPPSMAAPAAPLDRADDKRPVKVRTSKRVIVISMVIGFFAGAVCWHLLGFWWFVSDVMFHRRGEPLAQIARPAAVSLKAQSRQGAIAGPNVAENIDHCSSAARSGSGREAAIGGCDATVVRYRPARGLGKTDLGDFGPTPVPTLISGTSPQPPTAGLAAVGGWLARVEKSDPAAAGR